MNSFVASYQLYSYRLLATSRQGKRLTSWTVTWPSVKIFLSTFFHYRNKFRILVLYIWLRNFYFKAFAIYQMYQKVFPKRCLHSAITATIPTTTVSNYYQLTQVASCRHLLVRDYQHLIASVHRKGRTRRKWGYVPPQIYAAHRNLLQKMWFIVCPHF